MTQLFKCTKCDEYTLEEDHCPFCGGDVYSPIPAKFSLQDRYGAYRRAAKKKVQLKNN